MGRFGTAALFFLVGATPALAAELPSRKAGLWEVKRAGRNKRSALRRFITGTAQCATLIAPYGPQPILRTLQLLRPADRL